MAALNPKARALVQAGRRALRATQADRERVEAALRARLGSGALPADDGVPRASSGGAGLHTAASVAAGACVLAGVAFLVLRPIASGPGSHDRHGSDQSGAPTAAPTPPPAASTAPAAGLNSAEDAPAKGLSAPPIAAPSQAPATPAHHARDRLAAEVALLSRATSELRAGHAAAALKALGEHERRFPRGALRQERRAATAQALCRLGRVREGRAQLRWLAPGSPSAARARQVCDDAASQAAHRRASPASLP